MAKETNTLIDMHSRITAAQLGKVLRMQLRTLAEHPELAHVLPPLMVWGAPGLGNSSIIRGIANEMGIRFIDVHLAQREPVDVRGLPVSDRKNQKVDWMVLGEWPREGRGILLFDAPKQRPAYPVMWVLTSDGRQPARLGTRDTFQQRGLTRVFYVENDN